MPPKRKTAKSERANAKVTVNETPNAAESVPDQETTSTKRKHEDENDQHEQPAKATNSLSDKMAKLKELKRRRVSSKQSLKESLLILIYRQLKLNKAIVVIVISSFNVAKITQSSKQGTRERRPKH